MAKKKLGDILKEVFGTKLEEEIDLDESTLEEKPEDKQTNNNKEEKVNDTSKKEDVKTDDKEHTEAKTEEVVKIFEEGWYDATSGKINFDKIKNTEVLEAIKVLNGAYVAEKESKLINDTINSTIKEYSLNVSEETLKKVLDTSGVKIDTDGKVVGVKEALEALKTSEPGFFKDKAKESNSINEGFNPVEKPTTLSDDELVEVAYGQ